MLCPWQTTAELAQVYRHDPELNKNPKLKERFRDLLVRCIIVDVGGVHDKEAFERHLKSIRCSRDDDHDCWWLLHNTFRHNVNNLKIRGAFPSATTATSNNLVGILGGMNVDVQMLKFLGADYLLNVVARASHKTQDHAFGA